MSIRITTLYGWFIPLLLIFSYFNYREGISFNPFICLFISLLIIGISIPESLRILRVKNKKESKLITAIISLLVLACVIALLELKNRGIFIWNELYFTIPLLLFSSLFYTVSFITEDRHNVRVYMALDGIHYVHA